MENIVKKVCLCGDPAVGKTSLIRRFVTGRYDDKYISTLGSVISKKSVYNSRKDCNVKMMVWDISGQAEFKRIHASGFSNAAGGIAVCDITRPETVEHLKEWLSNFRKYAGPGVPAVILTNKFDLMEADPKVILAIHKKLKTLGCKILSTSAKTGHNVEKAFSILVDAMLTNGSKTTETQTNFLEMPERFENPSALLDYIALRFSHVIGDQEMGMYILRKQVADENIDFNKISKEEVRELIKPLIKVITDLIGEEAAKELRQDLIRALQRCNG
jgi:small GTP-binding protein